VSREKCKTGEKQEAARKLLGSFDEDSFTWVDPDHPKRPGIPASNIAPSVEIFDDEEDR